MSKRNEVLSSIFSRQALTDLKEAETWYNLQQKGLGKRLITDVKNTVTSIKQNPSFYSVKFFNSRTFACKSFSYSIHYEIDETDTIIRIVSIFHFNRQPYWVND